MYNVMRTRKVMRRGRGSELVLLVKKLSRMALEGEVRTAAAGTVVGREECIGNGRGAICVDVKRVQESRLGS